MDIRDRVMGDQPHDFLHKIAGIVPGYHGYMDRERRRDADKMLRVQLSRQYLEQHGRLLRVQQDLLQAHKLDLVARVDREATALQRFADRLAIATYGYSGLFDPIRVEAADLDQLYAFDMSLASGVDKVSGAVDALESAVGSSGQELTASINGLASVLDELNQRFSERAELLTSGKRLSDNEYKAVLSSINQPPAAPAGGEVARVSDASAAMGTPTTNLGASATAAAGGIQTASSPTAHPSAPGGDIPQSLDMAAPGPEATSHVDVPDSLKPIGDESQS